MDWNPDKATMAVFDALLTYQEIHGDKATFTLIRDEFTRLTVTRERRETSAENLQLIRANAELEKRLGIADEALQFYADQDNYKKRGSRSAAIEDDKGHTARDALEAITDGADVKEGGAD